MNNNNNKNNKKKSQRGAQKAAAQMAALRNEIDNLKKQAKANGGNAKPKRRRNRQGNGDGFAQSKAGNKDSFPVKEHEYIAEIVPTAFPAFSVQSFPVNPGQVGTFPWLSGIADNFEKYEFDSLTFIYKREVSEFATNGVQGKVIMMFDSDASDVAPTTKQQMEDTLPHADCMPCENMRMDIPKHMLKKLNDAHFVRPGSQPANTDLKTYDVGTLYVACQGTAANTAVGELHVEYTLRLRIPVLTHDSKVGTLAAGGGSIAAATPFGAVPVAQGQLGLSGASTNTLTITGLQVGQEIQVNSAIIGTVITAIALNTLVGLTLKFTEFAGFPAAANTGAVLSTYIVTQSAPVSVNLAITATTVTACSTVVVVLAPAPSF